MEAVEKGEAVRVASKDFEGVSWALAGDRVAKVWTRLVTEEPLPSVVDDFFESLWIGVCNLVTSEPPITVDVFNESILVVLLPPLDNIRSNSASLEMLGLRGTEPIE